MWAPGHGWAPIRRTARSGGGSPHDRRAARCRRSREVPVVMAARGAVIGIDARAADAVPTGLTTYARELVRAVTTIGREHSFVVIRRPDCGPPLAEGPNVRELLKTGDASTP